MSLVWKSSPTPALEQGTENPTVLAHSVLDVRESFSVRNFMTVCRAGKSFIHLHMYRAASSSTHSAHQQDKILIFLSSRTSTHFMCLHLSCFNIHLAYCCFIITVIPTRLSENWFYATCLNGRRKTPCRLKKRKKKKKWQTRKVKV